MVCEGGVVQALVWVKADVDEVRSGGQHLGHQSDLRTAGSVAVQKQVPEGVSEAGRHWLQLHLLVAAAVVLPL